MEESAAVTSADTSPLDAAACVRLLHATGAEEADVKRRELLFELALVFGGSQALGLLRILTSEEEERLAGVLRNTWRMDEATVRTFEKLTLQARRADDWVAPPVVESRRSTLLIRLNQPRDAVNAAERYLAGHDLKFTRLHGFALARYARALTVAKEIPEAAARLTEAADITRQHSSARLAKEINQARTRLEPWTTTTYVRQLDETLRSCGLTPAGPAARA